jgi:hypothetical protein
MSLYTTLIEGGEEGIARASGIEILLDRNRKKSECPLKNIIR